MLLLAPFGRSAAIIIIIKTSAGRVSRRGLVCLIRGVFLLQLVSPDDLVNAAKLFSSVKIPLR